MKKRLAITTLFLFGLTICRAQIKQDSVKDYYLIKNDAELKLIDSNYSAALKLYQKAFLYKKPNGRDLYNAFVTAYLLSDTFSAHDFYNQLILKGLERKRFEMSRWGQAISSDRFYAYLSKQYDSLYNVSLKSTMSAWGNILDSIYKVDQKVRSSDSRKILLVDSNNRAFLSNYIAVHGFPGFSQVGFYDKMLGGQANSPTTFWFIMWHARYQYVPLDGVSFQALMSGDLPPEDYALLMDTKDEPVYYSILPKEVVDGKIKLLSPPNEKEVNEKRAALYLDNIADFKKKCDFMQNGGSRFQFLPMMVLFLNYAQ
jgi:hypothetical protein